MQTVQKNHGKAQSLITPHAVVSSSLEQFFGRTADAKGDSNERTYFAVQKQPANSTTSEPPVDGALDPVNPASEKNILDTNQANGAVDPIGGTDPK